MTQEEGSDALEILRWDSDFFGFSIARTTVDSLNPHLARDIRTQAAEASIKCVYHLASAGDLVGVRAAEDAGFRIVALRVELEGKLESGVERPRAGPLPIDEVRPHEIPRLREIARQGYEGTRFLNDPRFPRERSEELYALWTERSCRNPADTVLVARQGDRPVGYIVGRMVSERAAWLDLLGVDAEMRRRGIARSLMDAALSWCTDAGATQVGFVTQGDNERALRLYGSVGCYVTNVRIWCHLWLS